MNSGTGACLSDTFTEQGDSQGGCMARIPREWLVDMALTVHRNSTSTSTASRERLR